MRNYQDPNYKKMRSAVLKRDKHKCRMPSCGNTRKLQVHHILTWASAPELRYSVSNGITLCKTCHSSIKGNENLYIELFLRIIHENFN